jgi:hypothetical protein
MLIAKILFLALICLAAYLVYLAFQIGPGHHTEPEKP